MKSIALLICLAVPAVASAQPGGLGPGPGAGPGHGAGFGGGPHAGLRGGPDGLGQYLYPPELILSNQQALGLTDEQVQSIKTTLKQAHDQTLDSQVALQRAVETLHGALKGNRVDEAAALAAAEQVMTLEGAMKRSHLALMIRIKNQLTPEQQQKLEQMRKPARANQE